MDRSYKVFIGGLPVRADKDEIINFFSEYGTVLGCKMKKNQQTGRSLGFAYLTVKEQETYEYLLNNNIEFQGRMIDIKPRWTKKELANNIENQKLKKIFINNIPSECSNEDLQTYFSRFGRVSNSYVIRDAETQESKGYGYILFHNRSDCEAALSAGESGLLVIRGRVLEVRSSLNATDISIAKQSVSLKSKSSLQSPCTSPYGQISPFETKSVHKTQTLAPLLEVPANYTSKRSSGMSTTSMGLVGSKSEFKLFGSLRPSEQSSSRYISGFIGAKTHTATDLTIQNRGIIKLEIPEAASLAVIKDSSFILKPPSIASSDSAGPSTKGSILALSGKIAHKNEANLRFKKSNYMPAWLYRL